MLHIEKKQILFPEPGSPVLLHGSSGLKDFKRFADPFFVFLPIRAYQGEGSRISGLIICPGKFMSS